MEAGLATSPNRDGAATPVSPAPGTLRFPMHVRVAALLLIFMLAATAPAATRRGRDTPPAGAVAATPPELSGYIRWRGVWQVSLRDPATGFRTWVKLRDTRAAYFVESFDERTRTAVVRVAGGFAHITLRNENTAAGPAPEIHVREDGKIWTDPPSGQGRHPNDPGNAD